MDIPNACNGKGRVILFASNPIYRWQNLGEFNMIFNSLLNWNLRAFEVGTGTRDDGRTRRPALQPSALLVNA